ncbi:fatty acyl-AMP ligase [soil metagenome]
MTSARLVAPTLVDAVKELRHKADKGFVFIRSDGSERFCSFQEIDSEASRRGAHFAEHGVEKGDRVAIIVPDPDDFVLSFLGVIYAGGVPVPMYPQLSFKNVETYHDTVAHIVNASKATLMLTTPSMRQFVDPVMPRAKTVRELITVDQISGPAPGVLDVKLSPEDLCFLQFTSGSTSRPKGVMVTHGNLAANSEAFMIHGLGKDSSVDKGVSWLPLFHDMGLIGFVIGPLFTDIPVVFLPTANFVRAPRVWLDAIHRHRGTITYAPNFAYQLVSKRVKEKDLVGLDLSCIRIAGCGAEPIQARTLHDFEAKLKPAGFNPKAYIPSYGMAEATLAITFEKHGTGFSTDTVDAKSLTLGKAEPRPAPAPGAPDDPSVQELVGCGRPFPGHAIAIVDEAGNRLGDRQVGQIITRGPSISQGYYEEAELTEAAFRKEADGETWLYTGDLGYVADGNLYICGRLKDIIIVRGRNFYPSDIEWVVSELPGVRRGNVVAFGVTVDANGRHVEDGTGEEHIVVCAEAFQSDAAHLAEEIQKAVTDKIGLAVWKVEIVPQGSLPRTSSGKPQRRKTKQMFIDGALPKPKAGSAADEPT